MKFMSRTLALLSASVLILALGGSPAVAQAHAATTHSVSTAAGAASTAATCTIHSLPSFVAQGELAQAATVADVIEVECDPLIYGTGSKIKISASQLFSRCGKKDVWYALNPFREEADTAGISIELDADGNATVAVLAGPKCQSGESLVSAHMEERPYETFTTSFVALPPAPTPPGVYALPSAQVEDADSSSVATIVEAEFAGASEKTVRIGSEELFRRCEVKPHLHWIEEDGTDHEDVSELDGIPLDNDGNGFVIVVGDSSCEPGASLIEADLESNPFTTQTTEFTIQPPQPTAEPSFTIEKLQEIWGGSAGFTKELLTGAVGDTVDYEIIVTNTSSVALELSGFSDPHCDSGTIAGGPGVERARARPEHHLHLRSRAERAWSIPQRCERDWDDRRGEARAADLQPSGSRSPDAAAAPPSPPSRSKSCSASRVAGNTPRRSSPASSVKTSNTRSSS